MHADVAHHHARQPRPETLHMQPLLCPSRKRLVRLLLLLVSLALALREWCHHCRWQLRAHKPAIQHTPDRTHKPAGARLPAHGAAGARQLEASRSSANRAVHHSKQTRLTRGKHMETLAKHAKFTHRFTLFGWTSNSQAGDNEIRWCGLGSHWVRI